MNKKRYSTFILVSGERLKITSPKDADWDLVMVNCISEPRPISIINELPSSSSSDAPIKNTLFTFDSGSPSLQFTSFRINKEIPLVCYLSKRKCSVQLVFQSESKGKLIVEQINKETNSAFSTKEANFTEYFNNEIIRILKSDQPLMVLSAFLAKYEQRAYFKSHIVDFDQKISDSITQAIFQMKSTISQQTCQFVKYLDMQMVLGKDFLIHDALLLKRVIENNPKIVPEVSHVMMRAKNMMTFLILLLETNQFDKSIFLHRLQYPDKTELYFSFRILSYLVDEQIPFYYSTLNLFTSFVPTPLLQLLFSSNKIYKDSEILPKQFISQKKDNKSILEIGKSETVFQINEVDIQLPSQASKIIIKNTNSTANTYNRPKKLSLDNDNANHFSVAKTVPNLKSSEIQHIDFKESVKPRRNFTITTSNFSHYNLLARNIKTDKFDNIVITMTTLFTMLVLGFTWMHFSFYID